MFCLQGRTWDANNSRVAYEYSVPFSSAATTTAAGSEQLLLRCSHREEPKVLLDAEGQPELLITQVSHFTSKLQSTF